MSKAGTNLRQDKQMIDGDQGDVGKTGGAGEWPVRAGSVIAIRCPMREPPSIADLDKKSNRSFLAYRCTHEHNRASIRDVYTTLLLTPPDWQGFVFLRMQPLRRLNSGGKRGNFSDNR